MPNRAVSSVYDLGFPACHRHGARPHFSRSTDSCYIECVIYLIYKDGEILVETDNLEFVKDYMKTDPECSVRDARTGKKIPLE